VADWDADVVVDEALVSSLLGAQFPELDASSARLLAEGWDYSVWAVEERWAFRFPRREVAIPGVEREIDVLPRLAPLLAVPLPRPLFVGAPSARFPWPFFGATLHPGVEPAEADLGDAQRTELGAQLGRVLRSLHASETLARVDPRGALPIDANRRADMRLRVRRARENLEALEAHGLWRAPASLYGVLASAEALGPSTAEPTLAHGDLHQRNLLVDGGALSAIIDWVDVCRADPCIDLVTFWSLLSRPGRERFLEEYGDATDEQLLRARVLAIGLDSMLARYAHEVGNEPLLRETISGLERALLDWG
jgi:aminoglycoside phosphotransferase (APT) family kinase protein